MVPGNTLPGPSLDARLDNAEWDDVGADGIRQAASNATGWMKRVKLGKESCGRKAEEAAERDATEKS